MRPTLLAAALALGTGCASNSNGDDDGAPVDCSMVTGADTFTVGLEKSGVGGSVDMKLMSISPAPAIRGNNTWVVQIASMASGVVGSPMDGATLDISSYMPAHGHYSPITPVITATGTAGEYSISPINLWMPGLWQTTITVSSSQPADRAVFAFCVNE